MDLQIRRLKGRDVFTFLRILKKLNKDNSLRNLLKEINEKIVNDEMNKFELYGTEIICILVENLDAVENDVYEFLGDIVGMKAEDFSNLDLVDLVQIIKNIIEKNDIKAFFDAVSKLIELN